MAIVPAAGTILLRKGNEIIAFIDEATGSLKRVDEAIMSIPWGQRPSPSAYMTQAQIDAHLALFNEGAVRITPTANVSQYGTAGPNGGFVMPRFEFERIMQGTGGNLIQIEQKLGLTPGSLQSGDVSIFAIAPQDYRGLRISSGNEPGAHNNPNWRPGGYASGGLAEADYGSELHKGNQYYYRINY